MTPSGIDFSSPPGAASGNLVLLLSVLMWIDFTGSATTVLASKAFMAIAIANILVVLIQPESARHSSQLRGPE